jgi:hypothetical protein
MGETAVRILPPATGPNGMTLAKVGLDSSLAI